MTQNEQRLMQAVDDAQALASILRIVLGDASDEVDLIRRKIKENAAELDSAFSLFCDEVNAEIRVLKAAA